MPAGPRARRRRPVRVRGREDELVGVGIEPVDLTRVRAQQLARPTGDDVVKVLAQGDCGERLAQLRQGRQRRHAPPRLLVQLGVLDRAGDQRRRVDEEVEHVVVELTRRHGVQDADADHVA